VPLPVKFSPRALREETSHSLLAVWTQTGDDLIGLDTRPYNQRFRTVSHLPRCVALYCFSFERKTNAVEDLLSFGTHGIVVPTNDHVSA